MVVMAGKAKLLNSSLSEARLQDYLAKYTGSIKDLG
jgi:hypothetical protein